MIGGMEQHEHTELTIKRVYEAPSKDDGFRVLVDRLWPRGVSKERAGLDLWLKEIAPSPQLRTWFHHDADKFNEFSNRYERELDDNYAVGRLLDICRSHAKVTLLYGAKNPQVNHAVVLRKYLTKLLK